jgi:methionyl-tRNA formyltransferase
MKKFKLIFVLDPKNNWIEEYIYKYKFNLNKRYNIYFTKSLKFSIKPDLVFLMNFTKKVSEKFLIDNPNTFLVHESDLPNDKGFAPVAYQVLRGKNKICMSLIKVSKYLDGGSIYKKKYFKLNGCELSSEIRKIQAISKLNFIKNFLKKYPAVKFTKQKKGGNFNKRQKKEDSKLDINKSLKKLFNKLSIVDNRKYPAFFEYKNHTYYLKITKRLND